MLLPEICVFVAIMSYFYVDKRCCRFSSCSLFTKIAFCITCMEIRGLVHKISLYHHTHMNPIWDLCSYIKFVKSVVVPYAHGNADMSAEMPATENTRPIKI